MAELTKEKNLSGMHSEMLTGRSHQAFFSAMEEENFVYPGAFDVDFNQQAEFDATLLTSPEVNAKIRQLMKEGYGNIVVQNPLAKHSLGICILNRLKLTFEGSLGYFGCGLIDGPNVHITGRVGWSCAENMMAGTVVIEKNAGSTFGAAIRGGGLRLGGYVGGIALALASEEVAIRSVFPHEIDTFDPYEGEVRVWKS